MDLLCQKKWWTGRTYLHSPVSMRWLARLRRACLAALLSFTAHADVRVPTLLALCSICLSMEGQTPHQACTASQSDLVHYVFYKLRKLPIIVQSAKQCHVAQQAAHRAEIRILSPAQQCIDRG